MSDPALLASLHEACEGLGRVGVAVSGGGDSLAALVLAVEALGANRVSAVTVDHGLRRESAHEAAQVAAICASLGVEHRVLRWAGPDGGNLQDAARRARQTLIAEWAQTRVDAVVLAHTLDDQAETVLMRLARGSGVDGLSGMATRQTIAATLWLRPFLGVRRDDLRAVLRARGIDWIEDPTNDDERYLRVRARRALAMLADLQIDPEGLADTAFRMRRARAALQAQTQRALLEHTREERGVLRLDHAILRETPEIRDRLFAAVLRALSGAEYPPRLEALHRWIDARRGALMGCGLHDMGDGTLIVYREAVAVQTLEAATDRPWDGRWTASGPGDAMLRAMGDAGLRQLGAQAAAGAHPHWRETGLPRAALMGLPGVWRNGVLVAAPLAFWPQGWRMHARPVAAIIDAESQSH